MIENFDATQFISFDINGKPGKIIEEIKQRFNILGFDVIEEKEIREVKKNYFKKFRRKIFLELKNKTFIGEIEFSKDGEDSPEQIVVDFAQTIKWLYSQNEIQHLVLIMTAFAEENYTSDILISVRSTEILKGLYSTSKFNYDIWADNIIIQIDDNWIMNIK